MMATPKMWAIGMALSVIRGPSQRSSSAASATASALASRLACDSSTPLGRPVVPDE